MKFSALNVDFNGVRYDSLFSRSRPHECIKYGYPLQDTRVPLLSTNLARERLQMDTDLLHTGIITSTARWRSSALSGGTNIDDLERPWTQTISVYGDLFCYFRLRRTRRVNFRWNILEIYQDVPQDNHMLAQRWPNKLRNVGPALADDFGPTKICS